MRLWQRFASSKKARIVALAILGFAIFSYAAIILVSEIFGAGEDAGKVYRKLEGDRVLLMNGDTKTFADAPITRQGWGDTRSTYDTFWTNVSGTAGSAAKPSIDTLPMLQAGTHFQLWTKNWGSKLWEIQNCRMGNTFVNTTGSPFLVPQSVPSSWIFIV